MLNINVAVFVALMEWVECCGSSLDVVAVVNYVVVFVEWIEWVECCGSDLDVVAVCLTLMLLHL